MQNATPQPPAVALSDLSHTASDLWPLYCRLKAETRLADAQTLELPASAHPEFERTHCDPIWGRRLVCADLIMATPVVTDRDLIVKACLIAEDAADGVVNQDRAKAVLAECLTTLGEG